MTSARGVLVNGDVECCASVRADVGLAAKVVMISLKEVFEGLKLGVQSGRTDVVRSVLSTVEQTGELKNLPQILNEPCSDDGTLLHLATKLGEPDVVRTLLAAGADPGVHNGKQQTPFDLAKVENVKAVFNEELLQAVAKSNIGRVCQLVASGLSVNLQDSTEKLNTPLHWAASFASRDMVQCLCSRGANINIANADGSTPLHDAVRQGDLGVIKELLINGADPFIKLSAGKDKGNNAVDLAEDNVSILKLLENPLSCQQNGEQTSTEDAIEADACTDVVELQLNCATGVSADSHDGTDTLNGSAANGSLSCTKVLDTPTSMKNLLWDQLAIPPKTVVTEEQISLLWPQPCSIVQLDEKPFLIKNHLYIYISSDSKTDVYSLIELWNLRRSVFEKHHIFIEVSLLTQARKCNAPYVICHVSSALCPIIGSYRLIVKDRQLRMLAHDKQSLSFAVSTLIQLCRLYQDQNTIRVPALQIDDCPSLPYRGVLLDVSQGRMPSMETLKNNLDTLSLLKINQVHLYTRFQEPGNSEWQLCFTHSELLELDSFCDCRAMQLVPVLEIGPKVQFEQLPQLLNSFHDYVSHFTHAEFLNVGPRLSTFVLDAPDDENISVGDAGKFLPIKSHQTLQLCGYPLHDLSPQLLDQLPPQILLNEYGVQADHDFTLYSKLLAEKGIGFLACPGTATWNSLAGCPEAAICNIFNAVSCSRNNGGLGVLVCDWTGRGHLNHQPFSWPGFLLAAGLGWNGNIHWDFLYANLAQLLNQYVFLDNESRIGSAIVELGRVETYIQRCSKNQTGNDQSHLPDEHGSTLFQLLAHPDEVALEELTSDIFQRAMRHIRKHQADLNNTVLHCPQAEAIVTELQLTADMMLLATRIGRALVVAGRNPGSHTGLAVVNLGIANLPATSKTDLANRLLEIIEAFRTSWNKRYLVDGLQDSVAILQNVLKQLVPNEDTDKLAGVN